MKIKRLEHVALAVENIDQFAGIMERVFGLNVTSREEFPDHASRLAMIPIGQTSLELIEGWTEEAGVRKWIAARGQSLYHLCLEVEDLDAASAELREKGIRLLLDLPIQGHSKSRINFVDPTCTGDILFELAELPSDGH